MLQAPLENSLYAARVQVVGLPQTVPPGGGLVLTTSSVAVPDNEMWNLSWGSVIATQDTTPSPAGLVFDGGFLQITPSRKIITQQGSNGVVVAALPSQASHLPFNGLSIASLFLSGVVLQQGDIFNVVMAWRNTGVVTVNITACDGWLRFLPIRLVSEIAVAGLQASRQDQLLDLRLRGSRG